MKIGMAFRSAQGRVLALDQPWWGSMETPALTISEAARICGVRRRAIRRRHQAGEFGHSFRDADGTWRIPLSDLTAAGLEPHQESDPDELRIVSAPASHIERLRTEVAVLRERVRALEIIAREREERVEDLRTILRMLPAPREIDEPSTSGADEVSGAEVHAFPLVEEEVVSEEFVSEEVPHEEVTPEELWPEEVVPAVDEELGLPFPPPAQVPAPAPREEAASPFDAPSRVGASTATASPASAAGPPRSGGTGRTAPTAPETEPIVVLPDAVRTEPSRSEEAPQRPADLLEGAMSLWWPTQGRAQEEEGWAPSDPDASDEWREAASYSARRQEEQWEEPASGSGVPDQQEGGTPGGPSSSDSYDEASYDWMDPSFGRPPRHHRRRLGRFFRRHRRPR